MLDIVHTSLSEIQKGYFGSSELSNFVLSKNTKDRAEWLLASAYVLYLYKSHWLHISD